MGMSEQEKLNWQLESCIPYAITAALAVLEVCIYFIDRRALKNELAANNERLSAKNIAAELKLIQDGPWQHPEAQQSHPDDVVQPDPEQLPEQIPHTHENHATATAYTPDVHAVQQEDPVALLRQDLITLLQRTTEQEDQEIERMNIKITQNDEVIRQLTLAIAALTIERCRDAGNIADDIKHLRGKLDKVLAGGVTRNSVVDDLAATRKGSSQVQERQQANDKNSQSDVDEKTKCNGHEEPAIDGNDGNIIVEDDDYSESEHDDDSVTDQLPSLATKWEAKHENFVDLRCSPAKKAAAWKAYRGYNYRKDQLAKIMNLPAGASGPVGLYWHLNSGCQVVRKHNVIDPAHCEPKTGLPMEAWLLQHCLPKHPNLLVLRQVRVHEPRKGKMNTAELFFDYCNGGSLAGIINKLKSTKYLDECVIWTILYQIGQALLHLHGFDIDLDVNPPRIDLPRYPVIHRDLKPGNVFVEKPTSGHPLSFNFVLGDLGMAGPLDGALDETACGTPGFVPQEIQQAWDWNKKGGRGSGPTAPVNTASTDVYSLGATLWNAMTRQLYQNEWTMVDGTNPDTCYVIDAKREGSLYSKDLVQTVRSLLHPDPLSRPIFSGLVDILQKARTQICQRQTALVAHMHARAVQGEEWPLTLMHEAMYFGPTESAKVESTKPTGLGIIQDLTEDPFEPRGGWVPVPVHPAAGIADEGRGDPTNNQRDGGSGVRLAVTGTVWHHPGGRNEG